MHSLVVSAPGKVILFGDHSVVYNRRAIAASISLRTTLTYTRHDQETLVLDFPDIDLHFSVSKDELVKLSKLVTHDRSQEPDRILDTGILQSIDTYIDSKSVTGVRKAATATFIYLFLMLSSSCDNKQKAFGSYHITSALPIGAGLGSSATVSVIIATALLMLGGQIEHPLRQEDDPVAKKLINNWAFVGEQCIHGTPSGVDNTVATYGGAVAFQKDQAAELIAIPALPLILTNTGVPRNTKDQVAGVAALRSEFASVIEPVLDAMNQVALDAQAMLSNPEQIDITRLGRLMVLNQGLLRTLGVSHASIEEVIEAKMNQGWTKLIGAGGGGCVITLLRTMPKEEATTLPVSAKHTGMQEYCIDLGGPGVGVHRGDELLYF